MIFKTNRFRLFALIINCTIMIKTNSRFSRNVYAIRNRIWCNNHLRQTTTETYDTNEKGGYFRFDDDNNMSYIYILSITYTEMFQRQPVNGIFLGSRRPGLNEAMWRLYASVNIAFIVPENGSSPVWYQAIVWAYVDLLLIGPLEITLSEIWIKI